MWQGDIVGACDAEEGIAGLDSVGLDDGGFDGGALRGSGRNRPDRT